MSTVTANSVGAAKPTAAADSLAAAWAWAMASDPAQACTVISSAPNRAALRQFLAEAGLAGQAQPEAEDADAMAWTLRGTAGTVLAIAAEDEAGLRAMARALPHLGRQSWLAVRGGRVSARGIWPSRPAVTSVQAMESE